MMVSFHSISSRLISIESARLEFTSPPAAGVHRYIYGHILINGVHYDRALAVFKRSANDPQKSSSSSSSSDNNLITDLTLCGPLFHLWPEDPDFLYVDLHEANTGPLIHKRLRIRPQLRKLMTTNIPVEIEATGNDCVLRICVVAHSPSVIATTQLLLLDELPLDKWLVSGEVYAVQKSYRQDLLGERNFFEERTFPLFSRAHSDPIPVLANGGIPLDRDVLVAPVQMDMDRVRQSYQDFPHHTKFLPSDNVHGQGSSITIHVDLKLVMDNGDPCVLVGDPKFEVNGTHEEGTRYEQHLVGALKRKGNAQFSGSEKQYCLSRDVKLKTDRREEIDSFTSADQRMLTLNVSLAPINHRHF